MPKPPVFPKYSVRKSNLTAYVSVGGRKIYLGRYDSEKAKRRYNAICARISAGITDPILAAQFDDDQDIADLVAQYLTWASTYYSDGEVSNLTAALKPLVALFGDMAADQFGPRDLICYRNHLPPKGLCRNNCNAMLGRVKRFWKWCSSRELCDPLMHHRLSCVNGLRPGELGVKESEPVFGACPESIAGVLPFLPPIVATMVRLQYLTGMRPGEVCAMQRSTLDQRDSDVWLYYPPTHKNQWRGQDLVKAIPVIAQPLLEPFLALPADQYFFRPEDSHAWAREQQTMRRPLRKTKRYPSEAKRLAREQRNKPRRRSRFKPHYTTGSYRQAIDRAFKYAAEQGAHLERFTPNQLRHSVLTDVTDLLGEESAQKYAGHKSVKSTRIYTQKQLQQRAADLIRIARQLDEAWAKSA